MTNYINSMSNFLNIRVILILMAFVAYVPLSTAATTDLATVPLSNSSTSVVKANMMFILDDSGSMNFNYMPDYIGRGTDQNNKCKTHRDLDNDTRTDCNGAIDGGGFLP